MKTTLHTLALLAVFAVTPAFLTGCAKDGYEQAEVTKESANTFRTSLTELASQISVTNNSLQILTSDTTTEPTSRFKVFSEAVNKVVSQHETFVSKSDDMQAAAKKTIETREKLIAQISDVNMRKTASESKEDYAQQYQAVKATTQNAIDANRAYIAKLLDIRDMLSTDLSAKGIANAKSYVGGITDLGKDATSKLDSLSEMVKKVSTITARPTATPASATN